MDSIQNYLRYTTILQDSSIQRSDFQPFQVVDPSRGGSTPQTQAQSASSPVSNNDSTETSPINELQTALAGLLKIDDATTTTAFNREEEEGKFEK
jgi:hypothetical protein